MKKNPGQIMIYILLLIPIYSFSLSLADKYPDYTYVFSEFGVNETYIHNDDFEQFVLYNETRIKAFCRRSLHRGEELLPMMRGSLMEDGLSDLFVYLSMVESGFSPVVVSSKKAAGLWQFMPATAKHYDLSVCNSFDERFDPVSSTNAAIAYLQKLHRQFGKWYLAAMAYNCGEGRLEKAIEKAGSDELSVLLDEKEKYLPLETREYIKKILLAAMIGEKSMLDFASVQETSEKGLIQVEVLGGTDMKTIAQMIEMKIPRLLRLNTQFKKGVIPKEKRTYRITIPVEKMILFYLRYELPEEKKPVKPHLISHYVSLGETLESIAREYNSSTEEIKAVNQLNDDFLLLDMFLLIPVSQALFEKTLLSH